MAQTENPLVRELREVINRNGRENVSNTPDFLLGAYLLACLEAGEDLIEQRDGWYNIHPAPGWRSADERDSLAAERERAAWTRDIAKMLRGQTEVAPELRPGILAAADWLNPAPGFGEPPRLPKEKDPAQRALMLRLEEQKTAIIAARKLLQPLFEDGLKNWTGIERWLNLYGKLADPPAVVEVEEDDDEGDDVPHDSPEAGKSSGRWQPLASEPELKPAWRSFAEDAARDAGVSLPPMAGVAHLDFAEDAARRAREADDA